MAEYIENPLSGKLRGVTYEDGKIIDVHIRDTDDVVKVFVPMASEKEATGMMDVREKLVELLTDNLPRCGNLPSWDNPLQLSCDEQVQRIADHLIMNGVTVQEWVSASEPPKKITNKVIVLCKNGYRGFGHYEDYKGKQTWYNLESGKPFTDWDLEDCESYEVTHWQPLPQPPKGE